MNKNRTYPKSLLLFGLFLVLVGLTLLAKFYIDIDDGIGLADLSDIETSGIALSTLFSVLPAAAGLGLLLNKQWGRKLVVVWIFIGFMSLCVLFAAMGLYGNEATFSAGLVLFVFVTWFINREVVRDALPPTRRERVSYLLIPLLLLAIAGGWGYFWLDFGGPGLPPVVDTPMPGMPPATDSDTYSYRFPGRFSVDVPEEYQLWYLDVNGMSLNKKGEGTSIALFDKTTLQESEGTGPFSSHFDNPLEYADKYFHERYGLGFLSARRMFSLIVYEEGYRVYRLEKDGMVVFLESGRSSKGYSETAHLYGDGEILGGMVYEAHDKEGATPPAGLVLPGLLATVMLLDDGMTSEDYISVADQSYGDGDMKKAILNYTYSLMLKPDDAAVLYRLGLAYEANGQLKESRDTLLKATRISPDDIRYSAKFKEVCELVRLEQAEMRGEL